MKKQVKLLGNYTWRFGVVVLMVLFGFLYVTCGNSSSVEYYTITVLENINGGSIIASPWRAEVDTDIAISTYPNSGYRLKVGSLQARQSGGTLIVDLSDNNTFIMPAFNVTIIGEFEPFPQGYYSVTTPGSINGGSINSHIASALADTTITLIINPSSGFQLKVGSLKVTETNGTRMVDMNTACTFIMPDYDVTVSGEFEPLPQGTVYYTITIPDEMINGSITASYTSAFAGFSITLTISPNPGFHLKAGSLKVTETNGTRTVDLYSSYFTMPAFDVTVSGEFVPGTQGLVYTLINGGTAYEVSKGTVNAAEIIIPPIYNELPVTAIADNGFYGFSFNNPDNYYDHLMSIIIPDSVTVIGDKAFYEAYLKNVTIGNSVVSIGNEAFKMCRYLTSINIPDSVISIGDKAFSDTGFLGGLTSVTIGNKVTSIGESAFSKCYTRSINIPDSVKSIGDHAFEESRLYRITLGNNVTSIGVRTFSNCQSLTNVIISDSVTSIGDGAFVGCESLTSITIGNRVASIGGSAFTRCSSLTSVIIPDSVMSIGYQAFFDCKSLTSVTMGNSLKSIGNAAFWQCSNLKSVIIPDSVTSIGNQAFLECHGLTSVTFGNSLESIGSSAFNYCDKLTSIIIPDSVTSIGRYAFDQCDSLTSMTLPFIGNTLNGTTNTSLGYIFSGSSLKTVIVTGSSSIGDGAFSGCSRLTSITIPDSVTSIGNGAFFNCSGLTSITLPDRLVSIGERAFQKCEKLTSITIPDSVTSIGISAFDQCSGLTSITIPFIGNTLNGTSNTHFGYIFGASIPTTSDFYVPTSLKTVILTGSDNIGDNAFRACMSLTSIAIPISVTNIGNSAFSFGNYNGSRRFFYGGDSTDWSGVTIGSGNSDLANYYYLYYYSAIQPVGTGNFWRFVDGVPTVW